jgi:hypothetical protein
MVDIMATPEPQSSLSWLDFSEEDRRRMLEVVALFRLQDTRDEMGIGSIRDTLADMLFPGTSTLQTRARYFLFVPWLYSHFERLRVPAARIQSRLRDDEVRIMRALAAAGERDGLIGQVSGESLQRFPASIYWNGLRRWGIARFPGGQAQYHRALDLIHEDRRTHQRTDDGEPLGDGIDATWDPALPDAIHGFPYLPEMDFSLRQEEASYLHERLMLSCAESAFPQLIEFGLPNDEASFIWDHPRLEAFPDSLQSTIRHAECFSMAIYGAALLYNFMLAELEDIEEWVEAYRQDLSAWCEEMQGASPRLMAWDRRAFWEKLHQHGRIPYLSERFVSTWFALILDAGEIPEIMDSDTARGLVREREQRLKRARSRFRSERHRHMWSGAAGAYRLDYRWRIARRIAADILRGLGRE